MSNTQTEKSNAIEQMRGLLKTLEPTPTDKEVEKMLEERRSQRFLK